LPRKARAALAQNRAAFGFTGVDSGPGLSQSAVLFSRSALFRVG
jgi:hypothetical protein